jgi:Histidine kinase-, DNA gyrase B-, and HSP90-like ATPase
MIVPQLRQVMMNLVTNAVDAMHAVTDRHRVLRIKTEIYERSHLIITVEDSGTRIDPKNLDSIFDPFFTTKSDRMRMGAADLLVDHRKSRRAYGGGPRSAPWIDLSGISTQRSIVLKTTRGSVASDKQIYRKSSSHISATS